MRKTVSLIALALVGCDGDSDNPPADGVQSDSTTATETATPTDTNGDAPDTTTPVQVCAAPESERITNAELPDDFCAFVWAKDIAAPRGLWVADNGDVLVVERGESRVVALWDDDHNGISDAGERAILAEGQSLNHGIAVHGGFLYASRDTTVFRWAYSGQRADLGASQTVVKGIPGGGHSTRTLAFDTQGRLFVSVGSVENVDDDSRRSRVLRFDLTTVPSGGFDFDDGFLFADGLRNEVGLELAPDGVLWGAQNGIDMLNRADLGGDIHQDNPAEILSRFHTEGAFHGYPWCWAEYNLPPNFGDGRNSIWAHPSTMNDGTHDDAWCRASTQPAALAMQGHSAPLDLEFYTGSLFPEAFRGDLFVTFHGSWNRDTPTGYKVVHVDINGTTASDPATFFEFDGAGDFAGEWGIRPVGVRTGKDGQLFVTSDASDEILVIGYDPR